MGRFLSSILGRRPIEVSAQTVGSSKEHYVRLVIPAASAGSRSAPPDAAGLRDALDQGLILQHAGRVTTVEPQPDGLLVEMEGPNADRMASAALNTLRSLRLPRGTHLLKRYGGPGSREKRVELQ